MFLLILISFGCTFAILGVSDQKYILTSGFYYTYLLSLGEFGVDDFENFEIEFLVTIFFLLASLLTMVVMFNILIAVISTIYENVIEVQEQANDFERISMIDETRGVM